MESSLVFSFVGVGALLLWSAFFSGSETALMSSSKARLHEMKKDKVKGAKLVIKLIQEPDLLLSTILLGNNLVNIAASALTTSLFIKLFGEVGVAYATLIMTVLVLIFAEVLPKTIASMHAERFALRISRPMHWLTIILRPATEVIRFISRMLMRILGINPSTGATKFNKRDLRGAIGLGVQHGVLEDDGRRMLDAILDLEILTVEEVMVHRSSMSSLEVSTPLNEIAAFLADTPHSRIPMWEDNPDNVVGILHVKDFFYSWHVCQQNKREFKVKDVIYDAYFVPNNTSIAQQLFEFRDQRRHMALVVDEYGDLLGLVTMEDIIEEIVGEIEDEHDHTVPELKKSEDGSITLPGVYSVRDANRDFDWDLPEGEDSVTIAGLMVETLDRIPSVGESIKLEKLTLSVVAKKRQAITRIKITENKSKKKTQTS